MLLVVDSPNDRFYSALSALGETKLEWDANQMTAYLSAVTDGAVPPTSMFSWYNPSRYARQLKRFMDQYFTTTQVMMGMYGSMFLAMAFLVYTIVTASEEIPQVADSNGPHGAAADQNTHKLD
jgi:hypothetical protein